jgi:hypothetical protein
MPQLDCFASLAMTAVRHCEERSDEAIYAAPLALDCFAALNDD